MRYWHIDEELRLGPGVNKETLIMVLVLVMMISKTCYEANWALHSGPLGRCSS